MEHEILYCFVPNREVLRRTTLISFNIRNMFSKMYQGITGYSLKLRERRMFYILLCCFVFDQAEDKRDYHCRLCRQFNGYFSLHEENVFTETELSKMAGVWSERTGFYRDGKCSLPRELRSISCLLTMRIHREIHLNHVYYVYETVKHNSLNRTDHYLKFRNVKSSLYPFNDFAWGDDNLIADIVFNLLTIQLMERFTRDNDEYFIKIVGICVDYVNRSGDEKMLINLISKYINILPRCIIVSPEHKILSTKETLKWNHEINGNILPN